MRLIVIFSTVIGLVLSLPGFTQAESRRDIIGKIGYEQRIALPPEASAVVVAEGRFGIVLGETTVLADGQQVPLPFSLDVPTNLAGSLSAVIRVHNQPRWVLQNIPFEAGKGQIDLGELTLKPVTPLAFATEFICGDLTVALGISGDDVILSAEGREIRLKQAMAASGARFVGTDDPDVEFWNKGDAGTLKLDGREFPQCHQVTSPAEAPYRARGNEPGWTVDLDRDSARITAQYGAVSHDLPRPPAEAATGRYVFNMPSAGAKLTIDERQCRDDATGMPYPDTAELELDGQVLRGCGGNPAQLLVGPEWQISSLGEMDLVDPERLLLNFMDSGRIAGSSGCNRIIGGFTLTGEGLQFEALGSTMMACPEPLMEQERMILDAMEQVMRFDISEDGALLLIGGQNDQVLIEARRAR